MAQLQESLAAVVLKLQHLAMTNRWLIGAGLSRAERQRSQVLTLAYLILCISTIYLAT